MPALLRCGEVLELRAAVTDGQVVDELYLTCLHGEVELQVGIREDLLEGDDGLPTLTVQFFATHRIGVTDLVQSQSRLNFLARLNEDRCGEGRLFVVAVFALPVEPEGVVETRYDLGRALEQRLMGGLETHHPAAAAAASGLQAEQPHHLGHAGVVGVVVVEGQVDVRLVRSDAGAGIGFQAGVPYVVDHGAIELLGDGPADQRRQEPVAGLGFFGADLLDRQPVDQAEARAVGQQVTDLRGQAAARRQREVRG